MRAHTLRIGLRDKFKKISSKLGIRIMYIDFRFCVIEVRYWLPNLHIRFILEISNTSRSIIERCDLLIFIVIITLYFLLFFFSFAIFT